MVNYPSVKLKKNHFLSRGKKVDSRINHLTSRTKIFVLYYIQTPGLSSGLGYLTAWEQVRLEYLPMIQSQHKIGFGFWGLPRWSIIIFLPQITVGQQSVSLILWYFCPKGPPIPSEVPLDETWARSCLGPCSLANPF